MHPIHTDALHDERVESRGAERDHWAPGAPADLRDNDRPWIAPNTDGIPHLWIDRGRRLAILSSWDVEPRTWAFISRACKAQSFTAIEVQLARTWLADCDGDTVVSRLTDTEVKDAVAALYQDGVNGFRNDIAAAVVPVVTGRPGRNDLALTVTAAAALLDALGPDDDTPTVTLTVYGRRPEVTAQFSPAAPAGTVEAIAGTLGIPEDTTRRHTSRGHTYRHWLGPWRGVTLTLIDVQPARESELECAAGAQ